MDDTAPPPVPEPKSSAPLVPAALLGAASFFWLWLLPIAILSLLNLQGYWLIEGNMSEVQRETAHLLGFAGLANLFAGFAMLIVARNMGKQPNAPLELHPAWGLAAIVVQVAYLWISLAFMDDMLPASVTSWIYPSQRFLYNQFAFAMLPLFLGILRLAGGWRAANTDLGPHVTAKIGQALAINFGLAVLAPIALYLLFAMFSSWHGPDAGLVFVIAAVGLGVLMFVCLVRALLLGLRTLQAGKRRWEPVAIALIALVLPVGGLLLNRSIPFPVDFQAWEVYALVAVNAVVLAFASWCHTQWPRLSFYLLCATLPFSLYFFIVFLPFTPLSILAIIVAGLGFLVLAPTLLFTLQLFLLNQARRNPLIGSGHGRLVLIGFGCTLLLPGFFTVRGLADKAALNAALDYVYTPALNGADLPCDINQANLRRALANHRDYKNGIYYPLLSDYYSWLVFDNLVLPDDKLARLEEIFIGTAGATESQDPVRNRRGTLRGRTVRDRTHMPRTGALSRSVDVSEAQVRVQPAGNEASVVTFVLTLRNPGPSPAEFVHALHLPAGVFVNGFRLHINGVAVPGRIVEKKTALWVYTMIRDSERRDPGLLFYDKPGELELRVFPVNPNSPSRVEIDFLVPAVVSANAAPVYAGDLDAMLPQLAGFIPPQVVDTPRGSVAFGGLGGIVAPVADREPYLHLIIDRSEDNAFQGDFKSAIETLRARFPAAKSARITLANFRVTELIAQRTSLAELPQFSAAELQRALPASGGMDLDLALARAIRQHRDGDLDQPGASAGVPPRPIFVVLSRHATLRATPLDFATSWAGLLPGLELHELGADGSQFLHRSAEVSATSLLRLGRSVRPFGAGAVTRFTSAAKTDPLEYWAPETSDWRPVRAAVRRDNTGAWQRALALQLEQQDFARSPGDAGVDLKALVELSRHSGILLPATSYIVVENQAQWRMLDVSERRKLGQNTALEFRETPAPPGLLVAGGFALWLAFRRFRRNRTGAIVPS